MGSVGDVFERPEQLGALWRDGSALVDVALDVGLDAAVPSCPGWTVADALWHVGEVLDFWRHVADVAPADPAAHQSPQRPEDAELAEWTRTQVDEAVRTFSGMDPSTPAWTWAPVEGNGAWILRRTAHEVAVHRVDVELAAGRRHPLPADMAADGLAEHLAYFTGRVRDDAEPVGGTVHLHATDEGLPDGDGEWLLDAPDPAGPIVAEPVHAKGDAAVRGTASDLLLLLWRRVPLDERFQVLGDRGVAERMVARSDLN